MNTALMIEIIEIVKQMHARCGRPNCQFCVKMLELEEDPLWNTLNNAYSEAGTSKPLPGLRSEEPKKGFE